MKNPAKEIEAGNAWYTGDQFAAARCPSRQRVVQNRIQFFLSVMSDAASRVPEHFVLLDAGCGDGTNLTALHSVGKWHCMGMDYNPLRLRRARENSRGAAVVAGQLTKIGLRDASVDGILSNHVLEHIEDDVSVLKELYRVLKDSGVLIVGVPNEGCLMAQFRNRIVQPSIMKTTDHIRFNTEHQMRLKLESVGFQIDHVRRESFFMPHSRLNDLFASSNPGFSLLSFLGHLFTSQCAGLHFVCRKKASHSG